MTDEQSEFCEMIRRLSGKQFQSAIFKALSTTFLDAQEVPVQPSGDGGADILTQKHTVLHCCYGLEPETKTNNGKVKLRGYVVAKFTQDIMRILELEKVPKKKEYVHRPNKALSDILTSGRKIEVIKCVCNYGEDNKIIGSLTAVFTELVAFSKCTFISDKCSVVFEGPNQTAVLCTIDQGLLVRISYPDLVGLASKVDSSQILLPDQSELDSKFDFLVTGTNAGQINPVRETTRTDWNTALLIMKKLESDYPDVHRDVEEIVKGVAKKAKAEAALGQTKNAFEWIEKYNQLIRKAILDQFSRRLPADLVEALADTHVSKLIGECPIDWRNK